MAGLSGVGGRYFWAVDMAFPTDLLPDDTSLIIADSYGVKIIRMAPETKVAPTRRKMLIQKFATQAAHRLQTLRDPNMHTTLLRIPAHPVSHSNDIRSTVPG